MLADASARASPVHFSSYKSKRAVRSVLGGHRYALSDGVDLGLVLREDINAALWNPVPVVVLTDSLRLCNVIIRTYTSTRENKLMLDITAIREAYDCPNIKEIGWMRTGENLADAFPNQKGARPGRLLTVRSIKGICVAVDPEVCGGVRRREKSEIPRYKTKRNRQVTGRTNSTAHLCTSKRSPRTNATTPAYQRSYPTDRTTHNRLLP